MSFIEDVIVCLIILATSLVGYAVRSPRSRIGKVRKSRIFLSALEWRLMIVVLLIPWLYLTDQHGKYVPIYWLIMVVAEYLAVLIYYIRRLKEKIQKERRDLSR